MREECWEEVGGLKVGDLVSAGTGATKGRLKLPIGETEVWRWDGRRQLGEGDGNIHEGLGDWVAGRRGGVCREVLFSVFRIPREVFDAFRFNRRVFKLLIKKQWFRELLLGGSFNKRRHRGKRRSWIGSRIWSGI